MDTWKVWNSDDSWEIGNTEYYMYFNDVGNAIILVGLLSALTGVFGLIASRVRWCFFSILYMIMVVLNFVIVGGVAFGTYYVRK